MGPHRTQPIVNGFTGVAENLGLFADTSLPRDAYWPSAPLAPLDEPVLFEPEPEPALFPPGFPVCLIVPVAISGISTGPPRIIEPVVWLCGSWLILYDDSECGLMEPSDPMSLYAPARLFD